MHGDADKEGDVAILSFGSRLRDGLRAAEQLEAQGKTVTVADARFAKPLDEALLHRLAANHKVLLTVEEGSIGGFATQVTDTLLRNDLTQNLKIRTLYMPDRFLDHDTSDRQVTEAGLDAAAIVKAAQGALEDTP